MRIPCPHCGPRSVHEFTYAGDATKVRPAEDAPQSAWCAYLFARENPAGRHEEYWHHVAGCRAVLKVTRDTRTHEIFAAELVGAFAGRPAVTEREPAE